MTKLTSQQAKKYSRPFIWQHNQLLTGRHKRHKRPFGKCDRPIGLTNINDINDRVCLLMPTIKKRLMNKRNRSKECNECGLPDEDCDCIYS